MAWSGEMKEKWTEAEVWWWVEVQEGKDGDGEAQSHSCTEHRAETKVDQWARGWWVRFMIQAAVLDELEVELVKGKRWKDGSSQQTLNLAKAFIATATAVVLGKIVDLNRNGV